MRMSETLRLVAPRITGRQGTLASTGSSRRSARLGGSLWDEEAVSASPRSPQPKRSSQVVPAQCLPSRGRLKRGLSSGMRKE